MITIVNRLIKTIEYLTYTFNKHINIIANNDRLLPKATIITKQLLKTFEKNKENNNTYLLNYNITQINDKIVSAKYNITNISNKDVYNYINTVNDIFIKTLKNKFTVEDINSKNSLSLPWYFDLVIFVPLFIFLLLTLFVFLCRSRNRVSNYIVN